MRVSVIIPVYNKAPFLREAVDSILNGTFTDMEVIAVDDKRTDESLAILKSITDTRMRIIELPQNLGPAGAANAGMDAATGEYIVRMDADDISPPDRITLQVAFMDAHPDIGASSGIVQFFGTETIAVELPLSPEECAAQLLFSVPVSQGASILRRSVLDLHGLRYDPAWPRMGEDWLFWLRMAPHTRMANMKKVVLFYRRGSQNISKGRDKLKDYSFLQREVFRSMKIPCTEEELDLHLMGTCIFKVKPTAAQVKALSRWYKHLLALNAKLHFAPMEAFALRVEEQWVKLFPLLPRYGLFTALAHLRLSEHWTMAQLSYLFKYRVNACLGRVPKG